MGVSKGQNLSNEWVSFPGGELEGERPKVLCPACREGLKRAAGVGAEGMAAFRLKPLCFQCYRAEIDRERAIKAAGVLDTASDERFQTMLPLEAVNTQRLEMLKADRASARETARQGVGQFEDRRRRAQIAARHALQQVFASVKARQARAPVDGPPLLTSYDAAGERVIASVVHAAELQLPEAWLPFVVAR